VKTHKSTRLLLSLCLLCSYQALFGGITGTLSGKVFDKDTGIILPGASIIVEGTTSGAMADKTGFYMIQNLPAGRYDVSVSMIGYSKLTIKDVQISVDLNTVLNFHLSTEVLALDEVVITKKRELIQSEITSSTYFIDGEEISKKLPIDSYRTAIATLPGIAGKHFRGGAETQVLYLLDGLPIQGSLSREISSYFPNSSIVEMMVQTGGFNAEYGHATSGIVNLVTKDGGHKASGEFRFYSDVFETGLTENDNTRRLEFNVGGPMTIGLGGPLIHSKYFISADVNLSDTPFREKMQQAFSSPIFTNYNINSKLSFDISKTTVLSFQGLLSNWQWHRFDPQWESNLSGLGEHKHRSHRLSASLTHTFSPRLFSSVRFANYTYTREVLGVAEDEQPGLVFEDPGDPTSKIIGGKQPWSEETRERVNFFKFDLVGQLSDRHMIKTGFDYQSYKLRSNATNFSFVPRRTDFNAITLNKITNNFVYTPEFFAVYFQDKLEINKITANVGLRYDVFAPGVTLDPPPEVFQALRKKLKAPPAATRAQNHRPLSPRIGVSMPLSENERLHVNYGWYYQMPPMYYLYTNADRDLSSYVPFIGNVDLQPIKTVSSEFSYKRIIADDMLFVFTGFFKRFDNLVDTQSFILPDSLIDESTTIIGFSRFTNSAHGKASGFEVTLQKRLTPQLSGRISYTFMKAKGTNSTPEDGHNAALLGTPASSDKEFPLSWDQRHSVVLNASYESRKLQLNVLYRLFSPLPVTSPGSATPNDLRLSWRNILDIKIRLTSTRLFGGRLNPFVEIRNVFDDKNVIHTTDYAGVRAYRLFDPINSELGRRLRIGMGMDF